jgi:hypothetical protein
MCNIFIQGHAAISAQRANRLPSLGQRPKEIQHDASKGLKGRSFDLGDQRPAFQASEKHKGSQPGPMAQAMETAGPLARNRMKNL